MGGPNLKSQGRDLFSSAKPIENETEAQACVAYLKSKRIKKKELDSVREAVVACDALGVNDHDLTRRVMALQNRTLELDPSDTEARAAILELMGPYHPILCLGASNQELWTPHTTYTESILAHPPKGMGSETLDTWTTFGELLLKYRMDRVRDMTTLQVPGFLKAFVNLGLELLAEEMPTALRRAIDTAETPSDYDVARAYLSLPEIQPQFSQVTLEDITYASRKGEGVKSVTKFPALLADILFPHATTMLIGANRPEFTMGVRNNKIVCPKGALTFSLIEGSASVVAGYGGARSVTVKDEGRLYIGSGKIDGTTRVEDFGVLATTDLVEYEGKAEGSGKIAVQGMVSFILPLPQKVIRPDTTEGRAWARDFFDTMKPYKSLKFE